MGSCNQRRIELSIVGDGKAASLFPKGPILGGFKAAVAVDSASKLGPKRDSRSSKQ
jgi:hypothetical protein